MANADVRATLFHDHAWAHGNGTPTAAWHEPGAVSPATSEREEERASLDNFWIDFGGEG